MRDDIEIDWNNMPYWEVTQTWDDTLDWENNTEWIDFVYVPDNDAKVLKKKHRENWIDSEKEVLLLCQSIFSPITM